MDGRRASSEMEGDMLPAFDMNSLNDPMHWDGLDWFSLRTLNSYHGLDVLVSQRS